MAFMLTSECDFKSAKMLSIVLNLSNNKSVKPFFSIFPVLRARLSCQIGPYNQWRIITIIYLEYGGFSFSIFPFRVDIAKG